jgi:phenylpyruvate tautomerase PptA (4-oxalocrotonate tautomerase family)
MPMIDLYTPAGTLPDGHEPELTRQLANAVLAAEGVADPQPFHLANTAAFIHLLPAPAVGTAGQAPARAVRIQIVTPPGSLTRAGQRQITAAATDITRRHANDPELAVWVILTEAASGGWGINGTAYGAEEFAALAQHATT